MNRLTIADALADGALATSTANASAINAEPLLGLVSQTASLVGPGGTGHTADGGELAILPHAYTLKKAEDIALLLLPEFLDVLVSLHGWRES